MADKSLSLKLWLLMTKTQSTWLIQHTLFSKITKNYLSHVSIFKHSFFEEVSKYNLK